MARAYVRAILVALEAVRSPHCGLLTSGQRVPFCECVPSECVPRVPSLGDEGAPQPEDPRGGPAPTTGGDQIRRLGTTLLGLLVSHRQRGSDLLYEAYGFDIGGET